MHYLRDAGRIKVDEQQPHTHLRGPSPTRGRARASHLLLSAKHENKAERTRTAVRTAAPQWDPERGTTVLGIRFPTSRLAVCVCPHLSLPVKA